MQSSASWGGGSIAQIKEKSAAAPFSDHSGPKGELCFWVRRPKQLTFRNLMSDEKIISQVKKAPVKGATAEVLESMRQEAQRGHNEILGGIDGNRGEDVRAVLSTATGSNRSGSVSAFDHDLGLRGSVMDLIPDKDEKQATEDPAEEEESDDSAENDISSAKQTSAKQAKWKRDEAVLRSRRKFAQEWPRQHGAESSNCR